MTRATALTLARVLAVVAVTIACIRLAWLSDDALITLRTALNLTHGWGAGYNATESVQAYTHPSWFLIWMALGAFTGSWSTAILVAGVALTGVASAIVFWTASTISRVAVTAGLLVLSNAYVEYATSGLENPLGYAVMGVLFVAGARVIASAGRDQVLLATVLGLCTALALLTRADYLLLILPAAGYTTWQLRRRGYALGAMVAACLVPAAAWLLWSWTTYSALLPNTLAAKTNIEIPATELAIRGIRYLIASVATDWVTLLAILAGIALTLARGGTYARMWAWGVVAYLGYVVVIGGDFMAFRFLAVPVFVCVLLLAQVPLPQMSAVSRWAVGGAAATALLLTILVTPPSAISPPSEPRWNLLDRSAVADERGYVLGTSDMTSAAVQHLADSWPEGPLTDRIPDAVVARCGGLGGFGLSTGPRTHVVDTCGLSDRLLAEQPFPYVPNGDWRVGHFDRALPEGYLTALQRNDPSLVADPQVRARLVGLWERIRP